MTFIDWWVPTSPPEDGETEQLTFLANHSKPWSSIGGKLVATDRRLIFRPGRADRVLGAKVWSVPYAQIGEIGRRARTWNPFDGGLRTRLRIVTRDGAEHLFVCNRLDDQIARLQQLQPPK